MIEYGGPAAVHIEIWTADKFDGGNTRRIRNDGSTYIKVPMRKLLEPCHPQPQPALVVIQLHLAK